MSELSKYVQWRRRLLLSLCGASWALAAIWQISDSGHFLFSLFMVVMRYMRPVEAQPIHHHHVWILNKQCWYWI